MWSTTILGGSPKKLADEAQRGAVSPDGSTIAYFKNRSGDFYREIWLMGTEGENPRRIVKAEEQEGIAILTWSPSGKRIAYRSFKPKSQSVESCDLNGAARTTISTDGQVGYIDWISPGRLIYSRGVEDSPVLASNLWEQRIDDVTGVPRGKPRRLTDWSGFLVWDLSATADGKHLAFVRGTYYQPLFVAELADDGTRLINPRRFTEDEYINMPVGWTADSREVIFTSDRGGSYGIYRQRLDGPVAQSISTSLSLDVAVAHLSPDRSWILFNAGPRHTPRLPPSRIYRLAVGGGTTQQLLEARNIGNVDCSGPDANRCVYSSESEDGREMVITSFDPISGRGKELCGFRFSPAETCGCCPRTAPKLLSPSITEKRTRFNSSRWTRAEHRAVHIPESHQCCTSVGWSPDSKSVYVGTEGSHTATLLHIDRKGMWYPSGSSPTMAPLAPPRPLTVATSR